MTTVTVISVSTPAVRQMVAYARKISDQGIAFHIHYICGGGNSSHIDVAAIERELSSSDLLILDLMGAEGDALSAITPALTSSKAKRIVINGLGPVGTRIGRLDESRFRTDRTDASRIKLFEDYFRRCDPGDIESAMNLVLKTYFGHSLPDPEPFIDPGRVYIKEPTDGRIYRSRKEYECSRQDWIAGRRTVALMFNGTNYPSDTLPALAKVAESIREFANVLPIAFNRYGSDDTSPIRELVEGADLIVGFLGFRFISGPMGGSSTAAMELIRDLDVPFLRPCFLTRSTCEEWSSRASGFQTREFMINGFMPELDGGTCIFPVGMNEETEFIEEWGITLSEVRIIEDRLSRLAGKIRGMLKLKDTPRSEKRIAIVGYNYPPGEDNLFGGSFLDTLGSISSIMSALQNAGYDVEPLSAEELKQHFLSNGLLNDGEWVMPNQDAIILSDDLREHPASVTERWGDPPGDVMTVNGRYFIPGTVRRNVFIGLQPPRSSTGVDSQQYHDPYTPPHHQYLAFYEWLRDSFRADAIIHIGTHGTVEFLPGKENAMSGCCFPDLVMGDVPHFYIYYTGNPSEAMIAKRRSHAALISYMPPPFAKSDLYGELSELEGLIAEYRESAISDKGRSANVLEAIRSKAERMRLPSDIDDLEHELEDIRISLIPQGFHVFGKGFSSEEAEEFAVQAMGFPHGDAVPLEDIVEGMSQDESASAYRTYLEKRDAPRHLLEDSDAMISLKECARIASDASGCDEMRNLIRALDGCFIDVRTGGDFMRDPAMIPTGYNIVQFDPRAVPSTTAFERGAQAASDTIDMYRKANDGKYPDTVAIVMWGLETSRTQGATLGQILNYLGFRMVSESGDLEKRFEPIPVSELGRPRIDVSVTICGFFRDMFSNLVTGLNRLFAMLDELNESDEESSFAKNTRRNYGMLIAQGYSEDEARDLSRCRLFGPGEGLYGTGGITDAVNSSTWTREEELSDIFSRNMGHAYSLKMRGADIPGLMAAGHRNVDVVTQMRDSVERELIDLDHYYEFFGGLCKTVEVSRGTKAAMYITDASGPSIRTMDVKRSIEHGIRTRLLNPKWIDSMLRTDYHGAQHIKDRFENVLGLAATTGAVDSSVFSDMESCYIADPVMRHRLMENNNWAMMSMIDRLSEASSRGYWHATDEELDVLRKAYMESEEKSESESERRSRSISSPNR